MTGLSAAQSTMSSETQQQRYIIIINITEARFCVGEMYDDAIVTYISWWSSGICEKLEHREGKGSDEDSEAVSCAMYVCDLKIFIISREQPDNIKLRFLIYLLNFQFNISFMIIVVIRLCCIMYDGDHNLGNHIKPTQIVYLL